MLKSYVKARKGLTVSLQRLRLNAAGYEIGTGYYYGAGESVYSLYISASIERPGPDGHQLVIETRTIRAGGRESAEARAAEIITAFKNTVNLPRA